MQQRSVQIEQLLSVLCPDGITASFGWNLLFASRAGKRQHIDFIVARLVVDMRHPVATFRYNSATVEFSSNYPLQRPDANISELHDTRTALEREGPLRMCVIHDVHRPCTVQRHHKP